MNGSDSFDRTVSEWLHADAEHRVPDHLDAVLRRTRTERQRPAWSSLERWLPMQTTLRFTPVPRVAWLLIVLGLIIALAAAILWVGSRPAPAGAVRSGPRWGGRHERRRRHLSVDPVTGAKTALITDPAFDFGVTFSRDGTKFMFLRAPDPTNLDADSRSWSPMPTVGGAGSCRRPSQAWTGGLVPDGTRIAFLSRPASAHGAGVINIANVDGSGVRTLDVGRPAHELGGCRPTARRSSSAGNS